MLKNLAHAGAGIFCRGRERLSERLQGFAGAPLDGRGQEISEIEIIGDRARLDQLDLAMLSTRGYGDR
jgi:hypothetical protein